MQTLLQPAYAKINLILYVTGRRTDGYHTIETIMQSLSLHDDVTVTLSPGQAAIQLTCSNPALPTDTTNLAYKAAALFYKTVAIPTPNCEIHLEKRIPLAAGLAGGSADAAAVLHALNKLHQTALSQDTLCQIGLQLGADIPYCICGGTMFAQGIGEILSPLTSLPSCWMVLCKPDFSISTVEAYRAIDSQPLPAQTYTADMRRAIAEGNLEKICRYLSNDLEKVAPQQQEIAEIKTILRKSGALGALMSGSGPTVFGIFSTQAQAEKGAQALRTRWHDVFLTHTV